MKGVLLGFEIATGIALFIFVFLVILPRIWMPFRAYLYDVKKELGIIDKDAIAPPELRRYFLKSGIRKLNKVKNFPPDEKEQLARQILVALFEDKEGVYAGMQSEMLATGMKWLASIPMEGCATCKKPIFTHEAVKVGEEYFCESCGRAKKADSSRE